MVYVVSNTVIGVPAVNVEPVVCTETDVSVPAPVPPAICLAIGKASASGTPEERT